jgi:hypothetical protein
MMPGKPETILEVSSTVPSPKKIIFEAEKLEDEESPGKITLGVKRPKDEEEQKIIKVIKYIDEDEAKEKLKYW